MPARAQTRSFCRGYLYKPRKTTVMAVLAVMFRVPFKGGGRETYRSWHEGMRPGIAEPWTHWITSGGRVLYIKKHSMHA